DEINSRSTQVYSFKMYASKSKLGKYDFRTELGPSYIKSTSSSSYQKDNSGRGFDGNLSLNIYLPGKLEFRSYVNYKFQAKTDMFNQNLETIIINNSLAKKFLEKENLKLAVSRSEEVV